MPNGLAWFRQSLKLRARSFHIVNRKAIRRHADTAPPREWQFSQIARGESRRSDPLPGPGVKMSVETAAQLDPARSNSERSPLLFALGFALLCAAMLASVLAPRPDRCSMGS